MKKVVIIHTTPATIESLSKLAKKKLPEAELVNEHQAIPVLTSPESGMMGLKEVVMA